MQEDFPYTYLFFSVYSTEPDLSLSIMWALETPFGAGGFSLFITCQQKKGISEKLNNSVDCQIF